MTDDARPPVVYRAEWEAARAGLLTREKELTRLGDEVSAAPPHTTAPVEKLTACGERVRWSTGDAHTRNRRHDEYPAE